MTASSFVVQANPAALARAERAALLVNPGHAFDHMATATWTQQMGWHN
jgi:branched-chain amino acid aminotransferase